MKRRILSMLLVLALVLTALPMTVLADRSSNNRAASSDPIANAVWSENVTAINDSDAPYDYVHIYGMDYHTWWINYADSDVTLSSAKTYRLSFATRGIARKNNDAAERSTYVLLIDANGNSFKYTPVATTGDFRTSGSVLTVSRMGIVMVYTF